MPAIILDNVSFSYGSLRVLDRVSLSVGNGERAFLFGPNGAGKSTLLNIVTGALEPGSGRLISGTTSHVPDPGTTGTVGEYLDAALAPITGLLDRFERLTQAIADGATGHDADYDHVLAELTTSDAWSLSSRIDTTLAGLGLSQLAGSDQQRNLATLSPGQRARLKLAALLILRPEALVLDEPTNHLDSDAIAFLSNVLKEWEGPILATSHDRAFIDETATVIYDLDTNVWGELARSEGKNAGGIYRNAGNYSDYLAAKATAREKYARIHDAQQERKRELRAHRQDSMKIARGGVRVKTAARKEKKFFMDRAAATSVKRTRQDDIELERLAEREVRKPRHYALHFPVEAAPNETGLAVVARNATVRGRLAPVSIDLAHGEHLLVTGANGAGKSTLLTWIATGHPPHHAHSGGSITRAEPVGALPQHLPLISDPGFGPAIWHEGIGELGTGILHPSMWTTPIPELSDGNQRRAQLAVALASRPAVLVVDEPTNYLDLDTTHALEDALRAWAGTIVVASHDRWLIERWHGRRLQLPEQGAPYA